MSADQFDHEHEAELAAREAARIGGGGGWSPRDPAAVPVEQGGGGEAEGFEQAEELLIERASHGDLQSAHAILHDQGQVEEGADRADGEADHERSSEAEAQD